MSHILKSSFLSSSFCSVPTLFLPPPPPPLPDHRPPPLLPHPPASHPLFTTIRSCQFRTRYLSAPHSPPPFIFSPSTNPGDSLTSRRHHPACSTVLLRGVISLTSILSCLFRGVRLRSTSSAGPCQAGPLSEWTRWSHLSTCF